MVFDQKLQFSYHQASIKNVQATGEAFSPQQRTSSIPKLEISSLFSIFWVIFALLNPDPDPADKNQCGSTDPDRKHWQKADLCGKFWIGLCVIIMQGKKHLLKMHRCMVNDKVRCQGFQQNFVPNNLFRIQLPYFAKKIAHFAEFNVSRKSHFRKIKRNKTRSESESDFIFKQL